MTTNKMRKPGPIKAAILNWFGFGLTDLEQWSVWYGRESKSGVSVTAENALQIAAVWACVRLVAQTIGTLPVAVYERTKAGRELVDGHPLNRLLGMKPNRDNTAPVFWECFMAAALLRGDGLAEKIRIDGRLVALEFLHPDRVSWERVRGDWVCHYTESDGTRRAISRDDIFHVPGFTTCGPFGMSVIKYGTEVLGSAIAATQAANSTFKNGLMPTTWFKFPTFLKPEQREAFRENLEGIKGALNAGKQPLLEGGMDVGSIGINPEEAQLLQSRSFSVEEICRWFGVPPSMIGHTDKASSWASSAEQINIWFLQYGLRPWLKRIETAIWDQLLTPKEQGALYAEFTVEGLLRGDTAARREFYASALQNGWMNRAQVARLENLPPPPGGDVYTVQSNLIPIDKVGESNESAAVSAALKHWLGIEPQRAPQ